MYFFINLDLETQTRFELPKFFEWKVDNYDPLNSFIMDKLKTLTLGGSILISSQVGSPDLLSQDIYGSTQYWWALMAYNDILTVEDLKAGVEIKYPTLTALEDFYFSLQAQQISAEE